MGIRCKKVTHLKSNDLKVVRPKQPDLKTDSFEKLTLSVMPLHKIGQQAPSIKNPTRSLPLTRQGFTLVEILVVIGVIVLLATFLFSVYGRVRESGNRAACSSNLGQIGLALRLYATDTGKYPRSWFGSSNDVPSDATTNYKWMDALYPYLKNEQLFVCPTDWANAPYSYRNGTNYGSYGMNCAYYAPGDKRTAPYGVRPSRIRDMAGTVQILDTHNPNGTDNWFVEWEFEPPPLDDAGTPRRLATVEERHGRTANALFCDGHVKAVSLDFLNQKNAQGTLTAFTIEMD
jgi:prepilin-type processing-associated H-X9-DG protein/prepilin-type N-terminal cleavage/methylation domain-containing protein